MASRPDIPVTEGPERQATQDPLASLVDRTTGLQPGRRLFHAANGAFIALVLTGTDISRSLALWLLGAALAGLATMDLVRLRLPRANALFFKAFRHLASPREAEGPASSTWYLLGVLLAVAFFPRPAAVTGILILAFADPAASYVGRRWGRRPFMGATLEGTALFAVVALALVTARHGPVVGVVTALVVAVAERRSWPIDDNLAVPVVGAGAITLLEALL